MRKPAEKIEESTVERAHVLEEIKISLAQVRAGQGLTAEESLADLADDEPLSAGPAA